MSKKLKHIDYLIERYPQLSVCREDIVSAYGILVKSFRNGGKLLIAGNGGSAADAMHIVGELMKSFVLPRHLPLTVINKINMGSENAKYLIDNLQMPLPAIALVNESAFMTAYNNDVTADLVFAQQVLGYGRLEDVFWGISTSGNSRNIIYAMETASVIGIRCIGLTGSRGDRLAEKCDVCIKVPEVDTFKIQELHLPIYHALCMELEHCFFAD